MLQTKNQVGNQTTTCSDDKEGEEGPWWVPLAFVTRDAPSRLKWAPFHTCTTGELARAVQRLHQSLWARWCILPDVLGSLRGFWGSQFCLKMQLQLLESSSALQPHESAWHACVLKEQHAQLCSHEPRQQLAHACHHTPLDTYVSMPACGGINTWDQDLPMARLQLTSAACSQHHACRRPDVHAPR